MKPGRDAPRAQSMKKLRRWIRRFIAVEFIEKLVAWVIWIAEDRQLCAQCFYLRVIQQADSGEVTVSVEKFDLLFVETEGLPIIGRSRLLKERRDRTVIEGKIFDH